MAIDAVAEGIVFYRKRQEFFVGRNGAVQQALLEARVVGACDRRRDKSTATADRKQGRCPRFYNFLIIRLTNSIE